ncbi:MAG: hypothetical protein WBO43_00445 [Gemmatimonadota bacterium]
MPRLGGIRSWALPVAVALTGAGYLLLQLRDGWFPWDEGSLAVTAEAVLRGGLPHRDFPELYTGGLTFLNAAAFRLFGTNLVSLRIMLLIFFAGFLVALFQVARRFLPTWLATLVVGAGVAWSVPNYPAAIPSWYNLFFATAGLLALIRYADGGGKSWVLVAGLCAGLSICAKIVGVYFVIAAVLCVLFCAETADQDSVPAWESRVNRALGWVCSVAIVAGLVTLISRTGGFASYFRFVVPFCSLAGVLLLEPRRRAPSPVEASLPGGSIFHLAPLFLVGLVAPLLALAAPYVQSGSIQSLLEGVFLLPTSRLEFASRAPLTPLSLLPPLLVAGFIAVGFRSPPAIRRVHLAVIQVLAVGLVVAARWRWEAYTLVWLSAYHLAPLVVVGGSIWLARSSASPSCRRRVYALLAVTAAVGLVEFPYAGNLYFLYTAPLVFLAAAALVQLAAVDRLANPALAAPWLVFVSFGVLLMNSQPPSWIGTGYKIGHRWTELALPRAGLRVAPADSLVYAQLMRALGTAPAGDVAYAGPDSPEVYFLTGSRDRPAVLFDFLEGLDGSPLDAQEYLAGCRLIVLNHNPQFSRAIRPETLSRVAEQLPRSATAGHFEVRWRE